MASASNNDRAHQTAGFSLIELVVAMALMALALGIALPGLRLSGQRVRLEPLTLSIAADLRRARTAALMGGRAVVVAIDPAIHGYRIDGASRPVKLPAGAVVSLTTPRFSQKSAGAGQVTFFPDGSSTGGRFTIGDGTGNTMLLSVEWLTGAIHVVKRSS
jgi:general secretion pathway protein H